MDRKNDWRLTVPLDSRLQIVKRISDALLRSMPPEAQEPFGAVLKYAWRLEELIFESATDEQDYFRRMSLRALRVENSLADPVEAEIQRLELDPGVVINPELKPELTSWNSFPWGIFTSCQRLTTTSQWSRKLRSFGSRFSFT